MLKNAFFAPNSSGELTALPQTPIAGERGLATPSPLAAPSPKPHPVLGLGLSASHFDPSDPGRGVIPALREETDAPAPQYAKCCKFYILFD